MSEQQRRCDFCAELVPLNAHLCPHCKEDIADSIPLGELTEDLEKVVRELDEHTSSINRLEADAKLRGGTFTIRTMVALTFVLLGIGLIVFGNLQERRRDREGPIVLGIFTSIISGLCLLVAVVNDIQTRPGRDGEKPEQTMMRFLKSLHCNRSKRAFVLFCPTVRNNRNARLPKLEENPPKKRQMPITDAKTLKKFWRSFTKPGGGFTRTLAIGKASSEVSDNGRYAIAESELTIVSYPSWIIFLFLLIGIFVIVPILLMQKQEKVRFRKLLIKSNGRWYFAESNFAGKLDKPAVLRHSKG